MHKQPADVSIFFPEITDSVFPKLVKVGRFFSFDFQYTTTNSYRTIMQFNDQPFGPNMI